MSELSLAYMRDSLMNHLCGFIVFETLNITLLVKYNSLIIKLIILILIR
jgi:hypothetical protein